MKLELCPKIPSGRHVIWLSLALKQNLIVSNMVLVFFLRGTGALSTAEGRLSFLSRDSVLGSDVHSIVYLDYRDVILDGPST